MKYLIKVCFLLNLVFCGLVSASEIFDDFNKPKGVSALKWLALKEEQRDKTTDSERLRGLTLEISATLCGKYGIGKKAATPEQAKQILASVRKTRKQHSQLLSDVFGSYLRYYDDRHAKHLGIILAADTIQHMKQNNINKLEEDCVGDSNPETDIDVMHDLLSKVSQEYRATLRRKFGCPELPSSIMDFKGVPVAHLQNPQNDNEAAIQGLNTLSELLLRQFLEPGSNTLVSTMDIIAMLKAVGALAEKQSNNTLARDLDNLGLWGALPFFKNLSRELTTDRKLINNYRAFLVRDPFPDDSYKRLLKEQAGGEVWDIKGIPPKKLTEQINQKVAANTNNLIPTLVTEDSVSNLSFGAFSTTYFLGKWNTPFTSELHMPFNLANGQTSRKLFLSGKMSVKAEKSEQETILSIPLNEEWTVYYVVRMPNKKSGIDYSYPTAIDNLQPNQARVNMPKLDITAETDLLGCLSGSMPSLNKKLWNNVSIEGFFQKARLKLTMEGVEAAAATDIIESTCMREPIPVYTIDRPHSFAIMVKLRQGGVFPLFSGYVGNPT
ncbi:MAG: serpin family protein [Alphaproteobacteria bacterium]